MNLSSQPLRSVPKPTFKRNAPTAKQRGDISTKVRRQLRDRSNGVCERCLYELAVQAAHSIRRWKVKGETTVNDVAHLCLECHTHCDNTHDGRLFLKQFRIARYKAAGAAYYE